MKPLWMIKTVLAALLIAAALAPAGERTIRIACIGNSITIGSGGASSWPMQMGAELGDHYSVRNFGVSGTTLLRKGDYPYWNEENLALAQEFDPHILIITLGTNDSKPQNRIHLTDFYQDYLDFINLFRQNGRDPQIYLGNPCPVWGDGGASGINGTVLREQISPIVDSVRTAAGCFQIDWYRAMQSHSDLFPDGIHPNETGYAMMGDTAAAVLNMSPSGFIRLFQADDTELEVGEKAMLYWEATPGSQLWLDGVPVSAIDSLLVTPAAGATYTLVASGAVADTKRVALSSIPPGRIKNLQAFPLQLDAGSADTSLISWSTTNGSNVTLDGLPVPQNGTLAVTPAATTTYTLLAGGGDSQSRQITVEVLPPAEINRALQHPVTASSIQRSTAAGWAVDGDTTTVWSSVGKSSSWLRIDLGRLVNLSAVKIFWGSDYATTYALQFLDAAGKAVGAKSQSKGDGGLDEITGLTATARYLLLLCSKSSGGMYTIREVQAFGIPLQVGVEHPGQAPQSFALEQNWPNPFNPVTTIAYTLERHTIVELNLYDIKGRLVRTLDAGPRAAGRHVIRFEAGGLPSGLYLYRLTAGGASRQREMVLVK